MSRFVLKHPAVLVTMSGLLHLSSGCTSNTSTLPPPPTRETSQVLDPAIARLVDTTADDSRTDPGNIDKRRKLACIYQANGMYTLAEATWKQVLQVRQDDAEGLFFLGIAYHEQGAHGEATLAMQRSISIDQTHAMSHARLGFWCLEEGDDDGAERAFQNALRQDPKCIAGSIGQARLLVEADKLSDAEGLLSVLRKAVPGDNAVRFLLGTCYRKQGRTQEARRELAAGTGSRVNLESGDPWMSSVLRYQVGYKAEYQRGLDQIGAGRLNEAVETLRKIHRDFPNKVPPIIALSSAYIGLNRTDEARRSLSDALREQPDQFALHLEMAHLMQKLNALERGLYHVERALRLNPTLAEGHARKGRILLLQEDFELAEASFRTALRYDPSYTDGYLLLAACLEQLGRIMEAEEVYTGAMTSFPDQPLVPILYSRFLLNTGDKARARTLLIRAQGAFPDDTRVQESLRFLDQAR